MSVDPDSPSSFLTGLVGKDVRVTLVVDDGRQEIGRLLAMDDQGIVLQQSEGTKQLLFRHAIAVIEEVHMPVEQQRWGYLHANEFEQQPS